MTIDELSIKNKIENIQDELNLLLSENNLKINIEVEECTNTYQNWDYVRLKVYKEL